MENDTKAEPGLERYPTVFSPVRIGRLALRNRILVPAHTTNYGEDNLPSERHLQYHRARAAGGAALIIFETIRVHPSTLGRQQGVNGFDPRCVAPFRRIAQAVRAEGARLFGQLVHMGRQIDGNYTRTAPWGPSAIPWASTAAVPYEMTASDVDTVVQAHVQAAAHLVAAGLDGIEVHLGHGHLLQQFLSPVSNTRTDAYGGSVENRLRLPLRVLQAVRRQVGPDYPMGIRISADEFLDGGLGIDDMCAIVRLVAGAVALDFVNVSHSAYHGSYSLDTQMADMAFSVEPFRHLPRRIAAALAEAGCRAPVFAVCKVRSIEEAEDILADGVVAMVAMARAHMADPAIVGKALQGREARTTPCIACNQGCAGMLQQNLAITCLANPAMGREALWPPPRPVAEPKRVLVVGAGPAGLEAAGIAAQLGHRVEVWEQGSEVGGQLRLLASMPRRTDFLRLVDSQLRRCQDHGVDFRFGMRATADSLAGAAADAVILAMGARPEVFVPPAGGGACLGLEEAVLRGAALGARVGVVDLLGSWAVASVVEHLADQGIKVTLIVPSGMPAWHMTIYSSYAWRARIRQRKVRIVANHGLHAYDGREASLLDLSTGEVVAGWKFDAVIAPRHGRPERLELPVGGTAREALLVGDCRAPRTALEAVYEGHEAARGV